MIANGVIFRPADNKRVAGRGAMGGWDQVRARLEGDADGKPMLLLFSTSPRSDPHAAGAAARRRAAGGRRQRHGGPRPGQRTLRLHVAAVRARCGGEAGRMDTWARAFERASSGGEPQGWRVA